MSNPGVLILTDKLIGTDKRFRVEDNLGESIHLHYNDIRVDLTIKELLYLSNVCDKVIYELVKAESFKLDDFDDSFLNQYSEYLMELESVTEDSIEVDQLYCQTRNLLHLPVRRKINAIRAGKILKGNNGQKQACNVVLFNNSNTIMYGDGLVAEHFLENPKQPIRVLRMNFREGKYSINKMPFIPFLFKWNKKRFINTAKKIAMKLLG